MDERDRKRQDYISTIILLSAFILLNVFLTKDKEITLPISLVLLGIFFVAWLFLFLRGCRLKRKLRKIENSKREKIEGEITKNKEKIPAAKFFVFCILFSSLIQAAAIRISSKPFIIFIVCLGSIFECFIFMLSLDFLDQSNSFIDIEVNGKYYPYFYRDKEFVICGSELENLEQLTNGNYDHEYKEVNESISIENVELFCVFKYDQIINSSENGLGPCIRIRRRKVQAKIIEGESEKQEGK